MKQNPYASPEETANTTVSTGRKLNRAPQRRQAMKQAQRAQQERERQALAAQKQAKRETAQAVAQHMAQKKAAQAAAQQHGDAAPKKRGVSTNTAAQRKAKVKTANQRKGNTSSANAQGHKASATGAQGSKKTSQRKASPSAHVQAPRKKPAASRAAPVQTQNPNHAPLYNQYEGEALGQAAQETARKQGKGSKQASPLTKATIRRRKRIASFIASLFVLAIVVVGVVYSVDLIFKVKTIEIQTTSGEVPADTGIYTEESIRAQLTIAIDDNFFSFSTAEQEAILQEAFPLLENIEVMRDYPNTVLVRLAPAVETYTMQIAGGWVVLSEQLHVMSTTANQPDLLWLIGATPSSYVAGQSLGFVQALEESWYQKNAKASNLQALVVAETQARSDAQIETIQTLLASLEDAALLADITAIDFAGEDGISFLYQDRIAVLIGTTNSLSYKISIVQYILWNKNGDGCASTDTGLLDVSYQSADGTITTTFAQGDVRFPLESTTSDVTDDALQGDALADDALGEEQMEDPEHTETGESAA